MNQEDGLVASELHESDGILWVALDKVGSPFKVKAEDLRVELRDSDVRSVRVLDVGALDAWGLCDVGIEVIDTRGLLRLLGFV